MTRNVKDSARRSVMERDGWRCRYCGSNRELTIDHIIPKAKGGRNTQDNLQVLCEPCNQEKGTKVPLRFTTYRTGPPLRNSIAAAMKQ